jgi:signal-transduction protein with cAMP-binding, CBS, and nucleotidyltransferase domain
LKEVEFLILYLKFKFPIFKEFNRRTLDYFVRRLAFAMFKPDEMIARKGERCDSALLIIDGEVEGRTKEPRRLLSWFEKNIPLSEEERGYV